MYGEKRESASCQNELWKNGKIKVEKFKIALKIELMFYKVTKTEELKYTQQRKEYVRFISYFLRIYSRIPTRTY